MQLMDVDAKDLKPISYARRHWIPRDEFNKAVSPATVYRWINKGVSGVKLDAIYLPAGAVTSREAVVRFFQEVDAVKRSKRHAVQDFTEDDLREAGLL